MSDMEPSRELLEQNSEPGKIDENLKDIMKRAEKSKKLSAAEIEQLKKELQDSQDFLKLIDQIDTEAEYDRVIFTDGNEELIYIDGEFFVVDTIDSTKPKQKKKKSEARDMYLEYFIRYTLNPLIEQEKMKRQVQEMVQESTIPKPEKVQPEKVKKEPTITRPVNNVEERIVETKEKIKPQPERKEKPKLKSKLSKKEFMELSPEEKVRFIAGVEKSQEDDFIR